MLDPSLPRGPESARLLLDFAAKRNVSPHVCLQRTGLAAQDLDQASPEIATYQEVRIIENLVSSVPDAELGLQIGAKYPIRIFGIYGFAMLSAPTMREIVEMAVRYQDLSFTLARASIAREASLTHLDLDASHLPHAIRAFVIDHAIGTVVGSWNEIDRTAPTPQIQLPTSRSNLIDSYRRTLRLTPRFHGQRCRLTFLDRDLDRRRIGIDHRAFAHCERECLALLRERQARSGIAGMIRARLERAPGPPPSMEQIATELHLSIRSLRRTLSSEGTSYRNLARGTRQDQAASMLQTGCSVAEIADRLGYNDPAAFVNAYKRWHGIPPGQHKRRRPTQPPANSADPSC
jgi:AraC-like DNA-binding protein